MQEGKILAINKKAYVSSLIVLIGILLMTVVLTYIIPAGEYTRIIEDGIEKLQPDSFKFIDYSAYPKLMGLLAPVTFFLSDDAVVGIVISLVIIFVGASFYIIEKTGILKSLISGIGDRYKDRPNSLIAVICLFFMLMGSILGTFEEVVLMVPIVLSISISMGWDELMGLGLSFLAGGFGFSCATFNPYTLGLAQEISGLPRFSGLLLRIIIFISIYALLVLFLIKYSKRFSTINVNANIDVDTSENTHQTNSNAKHQQANGNVHTQKAYSNSIQDKPELLKSKKIFVSSLFLILVLMFASIFISFLSTMILPLISIIFLVTAIICGVISRYNPGGVLKDAWEGVLAVAPGVVLIILAMSIKHVIVEAKVVDTIIFYASNAIQHLSPIMALIILFLLVLLLEVFISGGSAKAMLVMPLVIPICDMLGITRQSAVQAYVFGDGFTNVFYPTNPAVMIVLGFAGMSFAKFMKWSLKLQIAVFLISIGWLIISYLIGYGPF